MSVQEQQQLSQGQELRDTTTTPLPANEEPKLEEIQSQRVTEQIEDDLTALRNKKQQTPLSFYGRLGASYCFSFDRRHCKEIIGRIFMMFILSSVQIGGVILLVRLPEPGEEILLSIIILQFALFICLFVLDPGTLVEDEQEELGEQRYMCQNCRLYRYPSTVHCLHCRKCVRGYDHHCNFFEKCIGKRNYFLYCAFIVVFGCSVIADIASLIYTLLNLAYQNL